MSATLELAPEILYTAEDLEQLSAEGQRYELVFGELIPMAPVGGEQGVKTFDVLVEVGSFVRRNQLGRGFTSETGFRLADDPDTILAPDWAFVSQSRIQGPASRGYEETIPDLVLETRSPNSTKGEIAGKIALWLRFGVKVVWDLDPVRKTLVVHRLDGGLTRLGVQDTLAEEELLPGFALPLSELFRDEAGK